MRYFLPVYFVIASFTIFLFRVYVVRRRTGIDPIAEKWRDDVRGYIARWLVVMEVLIVANISLFALDADAYAWLVPFDRLGGTVFQVGAVILLVGSLVWVAIAQMQMGDSWRIGIDPDAKTELVANGAFRISRNPIFLGMRITLLGLFLASPNVLTLMIAIVGDVLMQVQVRIEEEYLESIHADAYLDYKARVPRWLFGRTPAESRA
jgi:protein-S-isoprenylcysteine O-methyltransferase Ste14